MTSSLPQSARDTFSRFVTTEYTTVGARQQPITWPVTPYYTDGGHSIDISTGLGYPKKADDAKRHPSVSLLFSDPTGSELSSPPQVLVQGTAEVDDANLEDNRERYWRESNVKLPATRSMHPPKPVRAMLNWYYTRIYVQVRPERVFVWADGDVTSEPEVLDCHIDEVRSGHVEVPPAEHGTPDRGPVAWDGRVDQLGRDYDTAVITWLAPDGFPLSVRVPITVDSAARTIHLGAEPAGLPLIEGRACLTVHRHAPDFTWQNNFQVRGNLERRNDGWRLIPRRLVGGFEVPDSFVGRNAEFMKRMVPYYKTARKRMRARA
jgi:hypothetical protein